MHPKQSFETRIPVLPSVAYSMMSFLGCASSVDGTLRAPCRVRMRTRPDRWITMSARLLCLICLLALELVAAAFAGSEDPSPYPFEAGAPSAPELGIERVHARYQQWDLWHGQRKAAQRAAHEEQHLFVGVGREVFVVLGTPP